MVALDTQLPNGYVGRRAFPMEAEGRLADFDRRIHPRQSEGCFVSLIAGRLPTTWRSCGDLATASQVVTFGAQIHPGGRGGPGSLALWMPSDVMLLVASSSISEAMVVTRDRSVAKMSSRVEVSESSIRLVYDIGRRPERSLDILGPFGGR